MREITCCLVKNTKSKKNWFQRPFRKGVYLRLVNEKYYRAENVGFIVTKVHLCLLEPGASVDVGSDVVGCINVWRQKKIIRLHQ